MPYPSVTTGYPMLQHEWKQKTNNHTLVECLYTNVVYIYTNVVYIYTNVVYILMWCIY